MFYYDAKTAAGKWQKPSDHIIVRRLSKQKNPHRPVPLLENDLYHVFRSLFFSPAQPRLLGTANSFGEEYGRFSYA